MSIIGQTYFDKSSDIKRDNMGQQNTTTRQFNDYNTKLAHENIRSTSGGALIGAEQCLGKQSHIFSATLQIDNRVEKSLGMLDELVHRLRVVSRDPKLAQEDNQSMPNREGNSELAQRLNGIVNGLDELNRRIAMQLDMLEI